MTRHNKKRYQREEKNRPKLMLSGRIYLKHYHDDPEEELTPKPGDMMLFPSVDALNTHKAGDYWSKGYAGYFRVDVWDGKTWQPVRLTDLFPGREHYFSKSEYPVQTFELCAELLKPMQGEFLTRTYREHYALEEKE